MNNYFYYYVQTFFKEYLVSIRNYSQNTISTYRYAFLDLLEMLKTKKVNISEMLITDFSYELVEQFIIWLKDIKHVSPKTINNKIAAIKSFSSYLNTKNLSNLESCIKINNIKTLREDISFPEYLSIEEMKIIFRLFDSTKKNELKQLSIVVVLYDAALRVSELCDLKRKNLIIGNNISIYIEKSKNRLPRTILLDKNASSIIKEYLKENPKEPDDYLFTNNNNKNYTRYGIYKLIKRIEEKIKNENKDNTLFQINMHPHTFRHSKATHMLDAGVDLITIRDFLGHKWLNSTEIYAHVSNKKKEETIKNNISNKKLSNKYTKKEINDLETWLREKI